jgi:hypothetical protein
MSGKSKKQAAQSGRGGGAGGSSSGGHQAGTSGHRGGRGGMSHSMPRQGNAVKAEVSAGGVLGQQLAAASSMAGMAHSSGGAGLVTPSKVPLEEDGVSSHADSDAHSSVSQQGAADQSMRIAQLEQQLREQAARLEQLALSSSASAVQASRGPSQWQQQQQQPQQLQQQQQQQQQPQQPSLEQIVRVDAVRPPELTYAGATAGTALEDWLFKLEQLFTQTHRPESDWRGRAQLAQLHWDRHMAMWWTGRQEAAAAAGSPILSWAAFVAALRKQFVPAGDSQLARTELFKLQMRSGETMEAYMQRAVLLVVRAGGLVESKTAAALALQGVDKSRFPFTCTALAREERATGETGMSFAQMREKLTAEAIMEPQLGGRVGGSSSSSSSSGAKGAANSRQLRINALQQQLKALEEGDDGEDEESLGVAPIAVGSDREARDRCYKCGAEGHVTSDCKSKKELRSCFHCRQRGHLRTKCPERHKGAQKQGKGQAQGKGAGEAGGSGATPGAAGSKPAPKNE